jgi:hypothetical protein
VQEDVHSKILAYLINCLADDALHESI